MKKIFIIILAVVTIVAVTWGIFFAKGILQKKEAYNPDTISAELSNEIKNCIIKDNSEYYKGISVEVTPESWVFKNNGKAEVVFNTKITMTPKAGKVDDLPVIRGMLKYLHSKEGELSQAQTNAANVLLNDWRSELKDYIGKPEVSNLVVKVTASIDKKGNVIKDTIVFFTNTSVNEELQFIPVQTLVVKTPEETEAEGFAHMKKTVESAGIKVSEESIPFLSIQTADDKSIEAYLDYWDLKNGKIVSTNKVIYTTPPIPQWAVIETWAYPLSWDGESYMILPDTAKIVMHIYDRLEKVEVSDTSKPKIFGKNVEMTRMNGKDSEYFLYSVKLWDGEKYVKKELKFAYFVKGKGGVKYPVAKYGHPAAVYNNGDNLFILVSYTLPASPSKIEIKLLLYTVNLNNWTGKWHSIFIPEGAGPTPSSPVDPNYTLTPDNNFYFQAGWSGLQFVDTKNYSCELYGRITKLKKQLFPSASEGKILVSETFALGAYKDIKIVGVEDYICVLRGDELLGILHKAENNIEVMDANRKVLSKSSIKNETRFKFPNVNGSG